MSTAAPLSDAKRKLLHNFVHAKLAKPQGITPIPRRQPGGLAPLALSQEQLLIRAQLVPGIPFYNESVTVKFKCAMDRAVLEQTMAEIIRRHEIWRTSYRTVAGRLVQVVHPASDSFPLSLIDLRRIPEQEREAYALNVGLAQTARPFDLQTGPLLRADLLAMTDSEYWLVMTAHQSIIDGVSVYQIFPTELYAIYRAFSAGHPSPLDELQLQFSDFACWERECLSPTERARQIAYWRGQLAGEIPTLCWPAGKGRPADRTFHGDIRSFTLPRRVAEVAHALSRCCGTTTFVVLLSVFYSLLHLYTRQTDLIVGTFSSAGRKRSEVQGLLGYFLNPVALRVDLSDDPSFVDLLGRVKVTLSEAISNDDVPFEHVVEALQPHLDRGQNPYFNVGISLQPCMPDSGGAWSVTSMDAESSGSVLDLYVAFIDRSEGLHARVQYNPDLFEFDQIWQAVEDFRSLLEAAGAEPQRSISELRRN
jgi:hypothetical protein